MGPGTLEDARSNTHMKYTHEVCDTYILEVRSTSMWSCMHVKFSCLRVLGPRRPLLKASGRPLLRMPGCKPAGRSRPEGCHGAPRGRATVPAGATC